MALCKIFVPYGAVGLDIDEEAFEAGLAMGPDIISSDAGSTDSGPFYLGTGKGKYATGAVRRDLKRMILGANKLGIPVTIGSSGTCGSNQGVDDAANLCKEICQENGITAKIAKIYTQQDPQKIKEKFLQGKLKPLEGAPKISEKTFDEAINIVALSGAEPFQKALSEGADIIIGGRSTDTAVLSAFPLMKGCDEASCWHAAKTAECGGLCTSAGLHGGVFVELDDKGFNIRAVSPGSKVSDYSVASHLLYENSDPFHLYEPGICIDTTKSTYTSIDPETVRVEGTTIKHLPYTMKLEGSGPVGFQTISIVGIRDRRIMKDPLAWINDVIRVGKSKLQKMGIESNTYHLDVKPYGYNAVSGIEVPKDFTPLELGILLIVTADNQKLATQIAKAFNPLFLHYTNFPDKEMPSFGFVFSPAEVEKGETYEFKLFHTIALDDPLELVKIEYETV